LIIFAEFLD